MRCDADLDEISGKPLLRRCLHPHEVRPDRIDRMGTCYRATGEFNRRSLNRRHHNGKLMHPRLHTRNSTNPLQQPIGSLIMPHGAGRPRVVASQPLSVAANSLRKTPSYDRTGSKATDGHGKRQRHSCVHFKHPQRVPQRPHVEQSTEANIIETNPTSRDSLWQETRNGSSE
jgi:hypothetical protein